MAKICPMQGCKNHEGMCVHDKMMLVLAVIIVLIFVVKLLI